MTVWGCMASSDALAGAVSGSNAVPLTTTVSIPPVYALGLTVAAANCWAWAVPVRPANRAMMAVERQSRMEMVDIGITPRMS